MRLFNLARKVAPQPEPDASAAPDMDHSRAIKAIRDFANSPAMEVLRNYAASPEVKAMAEGKTTKN